MSQGSVDKKDGRRWFNNGHYLDKSGRDEVALFSIELVPASSEQTTIHLRAKVLSRLTLNEGLTGPLIDAKSQKAVPGPPYIFPPGDYWFVVKVDHHTAASKPASDPHS